MIAMIPLQVYVDEAESRRLTAWSRARGWTKSQAIRAAIRALTGSSDEDPLLQASGMIAGLPADASQQFDRYLEESFVAKKSPQARAAPRVKKPGQGGHPRVRR